MNTQSVWLKLFTIILPLICATEIMSHNIAYADTYFVAIEGNDANPGTESHPARSLRKGLSLLDVGDILYVKSGTYDENINSRAQLIPKGTSWDNAPVISAYPGHTVILSGGNGDSVINLANAYIQYVIFQGFILDAKDKTYGITMTNGANHVRFRNMEVKNANRNNVLLTPGSGGTDFNEFIGVKSHDAGWPQPKGSYGFYVASDSNIFDSCEVYNNTGYGFHIYNSIVPYPDHNVVKNSVVYGNGIKRVSAAGILLAKGDGNSAYNNIVYENPHGIEVGNGAINSKVYNNTLYNNKHTGVYIRDSSTSARVFNNISYLNPTPISDKGSGTDLVNNSTSNPKFVNPAVKDFSLQDSSPAIDSGVTLVETEQDAIGTNRPQGSHYDKGALEYGKAQKDNVPPQRPHSLRLVDSAGSAGGSASFPAALTSPLLGATLTSTSVKFSGAHTSVDVYHSLWVGTSSGSKNIHAGPMTNHSETVSGLPSSGRIYVRYWSTNSANSSDPNAWKFTDQIYTMAVGAVHK